MFQNIFGWNLHGGLFFKIFRPEFENTENRKISSALILLYMRVISEGIAFQSLSASCCRTYQWRDYFVTGCKTWALFIAKFAFLKTYSLLAGELSCQNFKIRFLLGCKIYWPKKETDLGIPGPATDFSSTTASKKVQLVFYCLQSHLLR